MAVGDDNIIEPQSVVAARVANAAALRTATRPRRGLLFVRKEASAPSVPMSATASTQLPQQETRDASLSAGFPLAIPGRVIDPYYDLASLYDLADYSSELGQNIAAMVTNIAGFGGRLKPRLTEAESKNLDGKTKRAVKEQYVRLFNLFNSGIMGAATGSHSGRMTMRQLQVRTRDSLEKTATAYWEILADELPKTDEKGNVVRNAYGAKVHERVGLRYLSALNVLPTERDEKSTKAEMPVICLELPDGDENVEFVRVHKMKPVAIHFRRYVQRIGAQEIWFKEIGDPRPLDRKTGRQLTPGEVDAGVEQASEIFPWGLPSDTTAHGRVRWIGNLLTVNGDRAAEEVNYDTLEHDAIPALLFLVGGQNVRLSEDTRDALSEYEHLENRNRARAIVVEAEPFDSAQQTGPAMLDVKPLVSAQMHDAMFSNYQKGNADKIRSSFRQSPVFIGRETTAGKNAVEPARRLTDEQVYKPARDDADETINDILLPFFGIIYWCWESIGPSVTDDQDMIKVMTAMEQVGAMTPRIGRRLGSDIVNQDLGADGMTKTAEHDPDQPNNMQMAHALSHQRANNVNVGGAGTGNFTVRKEVDELRDEVRLMVADVLREELAAVLASVRS